MTPSIAERLAEIDALPRAALAARWAVAFGHPPPRHVQVGFLRRALAWRAQLDDCAARGMPVNVPRLARSLRKATRPPPLGPGTRLVREWNGKTHPVTVLASGFEYAGQRYRSLSAIARAITGTPWSGPAFFGLHR